MVSTKDLSPKKGKSSKKKGQNNKDLSNEDEAYNAIFGGEFGALEIGSYIGGKEEGATQHLPDAVDFEDEDELADEELPEEEPTTGSNLANGHIDGNNDSNNLYQRSLSRDGFQNVNQNDNSIHDPFDRDHDAFMAVLPQDGTELMDNTLHSDEFQSGNNALFMGMDNNNTVYMDNAVSYDVFSMGEGQNGLIQSNIMSQRDDQHLQQIEMNKQKQEAELISKQRELEKKASRDKLLLKYYFPDLKEGKILKWNRAIYRKKSNYQWHRDLMHKQLRMLFPLNLKLRVQPDQKRIFNMTEYKTIIQKKRKHGIVTVNLDELDSHEVEEKKRDNRDHEISEDLLIATDDWDDKIIIGDDSANDGEPTIVSKITPIAKRIEDNSRDWDWNEDDLVNANLPSAKVAELDMNDEKILLLNDENQRSKLKNRRNQNETLVNEKSILQKFSISNDDAYNILKRTHQPKVRAIISNLNIEHSQPAQRLQSPFYKVVLPRSKLRFFHRPRFGQHLRPGSNIVFSKLKTRKRKRDKGKDIKESFAYSQDLTIGDTAPVYLMEYSEQTPLALSKFGMVNKLINYYRKTSDQDTLRPKLAVGETHVLGLQDKSPFWNFGFVKPGHIVPTLYNNMTRAPVVKHDISGTDFLLVRSTGHGISNRYYLRNINHLFTVGQTFPVEEIPGPNSRKVTSMRTTRLRMIVYRMLNRLPSKAISIEPIAKHFPDQDYGQNRQKIKEFMKYQREGPDKGLWKLKEGEPLLDNENTKKLISPEQVAEVESMSQGMQFSDDNLNFNFDEKLVRLEENLLPWNATKNFVNATQMRAMIQIHGAGDPTGCGEGFSFLKTSMKGGFVKSSSSINVGNDNKNNKQGSTGHSYNVIQQQKAYDEEINKTWYTHIKSLAVTNPFEEIEDPDVVNQTNSHVKTVRDDNKVLRITRKRRDENGIIQRQTIVIRDPRVIKGYLRGREKRKEANLDVNKLLEDNSNINNVEDIEMQKKLLQTELASLEKSQQRRQARQSNPKKKGEKVTKNKNTRRRCATCGQVGHIRTNKSCPMYKEMLAGTAGLPVTASGTPGANSNTAVSTPAPTLSNAPTPMANNTLSEDSIKLESPALLSDNNSNNIA